MCVDALAEVAVEIQPLANRFAREWAERNVPRLTGLLYDSLNGSALI